MSDYDRFLETGLEKCREEGINFTLFKQRMSAMIIGHRILGEDSWVMFYQDYAFHRSRFPDTVEDWADEYFQDFTVSKHGFTFKKPKDNGKDNSK